MLRKFLISTVIVSILILLTTLTVITKATSVTTLISTVSVNTTTPLPITLTTTTTKAKAAATSNISATVLQLTKTSVVNKFLNNAKDETTTSLLPLQPPLNVTSTTLASFILNQKHQQQQRQRKQQQQLYLQKQRQYRQLQDVEEIKKKQQKQQQQQQPQSHELLLNVNVNDTKETKKKNLDSSFVTLKTPIDVITAQSSSTHAYIPFDLDYNDPTEEKAIQQSNARQSTINEVLSNLFPKGFSDIFRFSYAGEPETIATTQTLPVTLARSTSTPFKRMPPNIPTKNAKVTRPQNATFITVSTTVTREVRREISPGHTEIVVEKIITDPAGTKSSEDFNDGSNSISKDELLRINRAAREASVLPSLLINPLSNYSNNSNKSKPHVPIVILNENNNNDDFVEAPEDDNQIAETQDVVHQVIQPPPAESTNFQISPTHQYNVRIIHDNTLKNNHNNEPPNKQESASGRSSPSYQTFVEQSKHLQNSLQEAPSRKFLKNFQSPILTDSNNAVPISKGNFHYEQSGQQNHIQNVAPIGYVQYQQQQTNSEAKQEEQSQSQQYQELHSPITDIQHLSDKDIYHVAADHARGEHTTPTSLVFVTINEPTAQAPQQSGKLVQTYSQEPQVIPPQPMKSPHEFVTDAMGYSKRTQQLGDHQAEQTENSPKPSTGGYTFVEVQKSINIHNKLITEKDGRLIEQHETIYPEQKYPSSGEQVEGQQQVQQQPDPSSDYVNLSKNPIHVEQIEEQHESAASIRQEQHALNPSQNLENFEPIQQSNLIQESHIIEAPQQHEEAQHEQHNQAEEHQEAVYAEAYQQQQEQQEQEQQTVEKEHLTGEILPQPAHVSPTTNFQIPYALPTAAAQQSPSSNPMVVQEIVEKHIPVPYGIPEPVGIPVHIQHFVDRPYPVETIVEKPVPYPVEKVVEKIVEKHVPVHVEKIVEKPVEVIVKKYIDRPVAIPIKIPVALHLPGPQHGPPSYGSAAPLYPPAFGVGSDHASTWPQTVTGGTFTRIPQNILKAYYVKMLKKLVPQMQQAYKAAQNSKGMSKLNQKPQLKPKFKVSDILYDLKPPPIRTSSNWDVGARYQYDYNTLPKDMSASSSIAVGKNLERPGQGYKTNFDEFQRWRNGYNLKRSPDFGRNLHMEYGFKPPLVPSVEIDDKGVPLKAVSDLTKGKQE